MEPKSPITLHISEIFCSIQGEGEYAGTRSVFVRTNGCNLRCHFCDTPYSSWEPNGSAWTVDEVFREVRRYECEHVVITGGEPFLQPGIISLCEMLNKESHFITFETAGTILRPVKANLLSISPKRMNSAPKEDGRWKQRHEQLRHNPKVISEMLKSYECQFKFVIDKEEDLNDVLEYQSEFSELNSDMIWLMPQAIEKEELLEKEAWLKPLALKNGFRYSSRMQIIQFGNLPGT